MVIPTIAADILLQGLIERLAASGGVVHATGLWGSSAPMVTALAAARVPRVFLYITAHLEEADNARDDLELFQGVACRLFPAWEGAPGEGAASGEIEAERLRLCAWLGGSAAAGGVLVAPIQALMQPVPTRTALARNTIVLCAGGERRAGEWALSPDGLVEWAIERGFERLERVEEAGDVARRGSIVDLFIPGDEHPVRIEFDEEEVESLRRFDVATQRSVEALDSITVTVMPTNWHSAQPSGSAADIGDTEVGSGGSRSEGQGGPTRRARRGDRASAVGAEGVAELFDYLPADAIVVLDGPAEIQELGETLRRRLGEPERLIAVQDVLARAAGFRQLHLSRFGGVSTADEDSFEFQVTSASRFEGDSAQAVKEIAHTARDHDVHVFCDNDGERQRLAEMLGEHEGGHGVTLHVGVMHRGFEWTATRTVVVPHHEIFHRHRPRRRLRKLHAGRPLDSWTDLKAGEIVVHVVHGIAVYRGLKTMSKGSGGQQEEYLSLEFADKAMVHVPVSQVDLVQQYIGAGGRRPQLSTLGGKRWSRTKQQVADSIADLAESLLRVQAIRREAQGTAYPGDTPWQREFEAAFLYEETDDQLHVADEIRGDLMRARPMDRLICGDVGYGKTELAMRAAFKVVEYGRQVAVLVPTTVLAEQHYQTFRERMAEYPFVVGCLSRFRSGAEQKAILEKARRGQIDVVIGTHRLLSKDVSLANLGLVIIDEEQRFGVEHKERLKAMRETVDVLTLTATPIPRTLHMSMMGIRDISSLQTPPVDRRAIATQVRPFERSLIREAILREMNRDGQVYFIHNFVQSIATMAETVRSIVPEARVVFGHGQMRDGELEEVMHRFVRREADVLVATTIIESGIDIPSVNTIFINRAERFGLADLHQLRGRVGRSSHRAYCYLLLSPGRPPTGKAAKRLKTIEEFSELGAGFRIAMRDLEIRGAGNLLGREQSGQIAAVGYELYCRLLDQTVRRLKNEPDPSPAPVQVDLEVAAHVPTSYIPAERSRIEIYRRIASCRTASDLTQLERDLADVFGPIPAAVERLLQMAELRVHARRFGILSISRRDTDIVFVVESVPRAEVVFQGATGTVRLADERTIHLRLPPAYLEPATLLPVLRRMLMRAGEGNENSPVRTADTAD